MKSAAAQGNTWMWVSVFEVESDSAKTKWVHGLGFFFKSWFLLFVFWVLVISYIFPTDRYHQATDTPPSTADNTGETVDATFRGVPESVRMVSRSTLESADSQSDTDPSDIPPPAAPSQPVLFEDSLVLNSPRITVPKKNKAVFKHNKWSQQTMFPTVSRCFLVNV